MDDPGSNEFATPTLMRLARGAYASSIRAQLHAIGVDDLPRNGAFILVGIDSTGSPRTDLPSELGVTKQAVSQLIDTLVRRGYLDRSLDAGDRRRLNLELTERGRRVAEAVMCGVELVDAQLNERVTREQVDAMRTALSALAEIRRASVNEGSGLPRRARQLKQFSPIFPVRDLPAALAHYSALGFSTIAYEEGDEYGFANRDGIGLHLARDHHPGDQHHRHCASTYLYVRDADAIYEEWTRPGIGGQTEAVHATPYKLREGSHTDPDGNLIRFGSPTDE